MTTNTKIEWAHHSWNPWQGCTKVSAGCANCYMYRDMKRYGKNASTIIRSSRTTFNKPLSANRSGQPIWQPGERIFICSWSDFWIKEADAWRKEAFDVMRVRKDLTYLIPTKRTERILDHLPEDWGDGWPNVWLMASVEDQESADKRVPELLDVPAAVHGISYEPAIGPVDFSKWIWLGACGCTEPDVDVNPKDCPHCKGSMTVTGLDWIICGGESGYTPRPMNPQWAWDVLSQCAEAGIPFFMKQMSGKAVILDGLMVRQFPEVRS